MIKMINESSTAAEIAAVLENQILYDVVGRQEKVIESLKQVIAKLQKLQKDQKTRNR